MRIVFHGEVAAPFSKNFAGVLNSRAEIILLPDVLASDAEKQMYASADVIVSFRFTAALPRPENLKLFHLPGAGFDAVDFSAMPPSAVVCNCFGHEQPIAEYVMAALLMHAVPLAAADKLLRQGDWSFRGAPEVSGHDELTGKTIGILGFGHIGQAVATRAKAFEMTVHVANRSPVAASPVVDRSFLLTSLADFWGTADFIVATVPLTPETKGIVGAEAFAAMGSSAIVVNVARGPVVEEKALYDALKSNRIAGAVIDVWYNYPNPAAPQPKVYPSALPFQDLPNIMMTPHMSGLTEGTILRRQRVMAENIERRMSGRPCINIVRPAQS